MSGTALRLRLEAPLRCNLRAQVASILNKARSAEWSRDFNPTRQESGGVALTKTKASIALFTPYGNLSRNDTDCFKPNTKPFMFNFRIADLQALLEQLRKEGVPVDDKVEEYEFGKFGWVMDPESGGVVGAAAG